MNGFMRATTTQMTGLVVSEIFYNHWCLELVNAAWHARLLQCKFAQHFFLNLKYEFETLKNGWIEDDFTTG